MKKIFTLILLFVTAMFGADVVGKFDLKTGGLSVIKAMNPDKLLVHSFEDPKIKGVVCHIATIKTGGISGALDIGTDPSNNSIACRQVGTIQQILTINKTAEGEEAFSQSQSLFFKKMKIRRIYDQKYNALIYVSYSESIIDGSRKMSISTVPLSGTILK